MRAVLTPPYSEPRLFINAASGFLCLGRLASSVGTSIKPAKREPPFAEGFLGQLLRNVLMEISHQPAM